MNDLRSSAAADPDTPPSHEDPMAADRRTMTIAASAMVLLIGIGVVSAALFTGSACGDIGPRTVAAPRAGTIVPDVVRQAFPELGEAGHETIVDDLSSLAERLGPISGIADVGDAERLAHLGTGVAALGADATALGPAGAEVRASAVFGDAAAVVGDGTTVFSVALANELTGQVDAIQPIDRDLEPVGHCLDTATVNVPFAFYLDAGDGDLLVFRAGEDAGDPELELRGRGGRSWTAPLEVAVAPPGLLGERLSARLGADVAVAARRVTPGETQAAVTAVERRDGATRWTVERAALPVVGDGPVWVEVLGISRDVVVLGLATEEARDERVLVGLDLDDGSTRWAHTNPVRTPQVLVSLDRAAQLVQEGNEWAVREFDPATGEGETVATSAAVGGRVVGIVDGGSITSFDDGDLLVHTEGEAHSFALAAPAQDVAVDADGGVTVLLAIGADAVAVTFGG